MESEVYNLIAYGVHVHMQWYGTKRNKRIGQ